MVTTEANFVYSTNTRILNAINALINGAPESLDTLKEIADVFQELNTKVGDLEAIIGTDPDADSYEESLAGKLAATNQTIEDNELTISSALNDLNDRVSAIEEG